MMREGRSLPLKKEKSQAPSIRTNAKSLWGNVSTTSSSNDSFDPFIGMSLLESQFQKDEYKELAKENEMYSASTSHFNTFDTFEEQSFDNNSASAFFDDAIETTRIEDRIAQRNNKRKAIRDESKKQKRARRDSHQSYASRHDAAVENPSINANTAATTQMTNTTTTATAISATITTMTNSVPLDPAQKYEAEQLIDMVFTDLKYSREKVMKWKTRLFTDDESFQEFIKDSKGRGFFYAKSYIETKRKEYKIQQLQNDINA